MNLAPCALTLVTLPYFVAAHPNIFSCELMYSASATAPLRASASSAT